MARGAKPSSSSGGGDPLKYYCIVFALLICVIGFVYWKQRQKLTEFRSENAFAEKVLTGKGIAETDTYGRPNAIPPLGLQVETMVSGYASSVGSDSSEGIAAESILGLAQQLGIKNKGLSHEQPDEFRPEGYLQIWREFTFDETTLTNLTKLLWNIESQTRYRILEFNWRLRPAKENSEAPFERITPTRVKVAIRKPLSSGNDR